jgi:hypothetical protein
MRSRTRSRHGSVIDEALQIGHERRKIETVDGRALADSLVRRDVATGAWQTVRAEHFIGAGMTVDDFANRRVC